MGNTFKFILGIETSCDETAAAVYSPEYGLLSNVVSSQISIHAPYGGVVPEIASRKHLELILPVTKEALTKAKIELKQINAIACTQGPGLVGALAVGWSFAKTLASVNKIPFVGVNHTYSHLMSIFIGVNPNNPPPSFPFVGLVVSGGHTSLYIVKSFTDYQEIGRTRDDAAGEAFDKVAKLMGLPYPGGPEISKLALNGKDIYHLPRAWLNETPFDFSFSGIKTAVANLIKKNELNHKFMADVACSFQEAVVDILCEKTINAAKYHNIDKIVISGGVSANKRLREEMDRRCKLNGIDFYMPMLEFCMDNAAMTAFAGYNLLINNIQSHQKEDVYSRNKVDSP